MSAAASGTGGKVQFVVVKLCSEEFTPTTICPQAIPAILDVRQRQLPACLPGTAAGTTVATSGHAVACLGWMWCRRETTNSPLDALLSWPKWAAHTVYMNIPLYTKGSTQLIAAHCSGDRSADTVCFEIPDGLTYGRSHSWRQPVTWRAHGTSRPLGMQISGLSEPQSAVKRRRSV
jgi:hypothetical protein